MFSGDVLGFVSLWGAATVASFAVVFFIVCGVFVLLHIANLRPLPEDTRRQLFAVFLFSTLASVAGVVGIVFSKDRLQTKEELQVAELQRNSAVAALGNSSSISESDECVCAQSEVTGGTSASSTNNDYWEPSNPVVFIHVYERHRLEAAKDISAHLSANGVLVPGIESVRIQVNDDQLRYFHSSSREQALMLGDLLEFPPGAVRFVDGFQNRVGAEHFEIWLSP